MAAFGLYTHIRSNRRRSVFLLSALFTLVYLLTFAGALVASAFTAVDDFGGHMQRALADTLTSLPYVTIGVAAWVAIAWKFNQSIIQLALPSHGLTRTEAPKLYNMLENLCISRGMPMPKLAVVETAAPNAYASGMNEKQFTITFTRGLLDTLDDAEVEAVMAHELTHIRNGDVQMMVIAMIIAGRRVVLLRIVLPHVRARRSPVRRRIVGQGFGRQLIEQRRFERQEGRRGRRPSRSPCSSSPRRGRCR